MTEVKIDIEHVPVANDPRQWSPLKKHFSLFLISGAAMIAGFAGTIQNPAVADMEEQLPATSEQFSLSISLYILVQGLMPLVWCAISEIKGRKMIYLVSLAGSLVSSIAVAVSRRIELVIAFRSIQAAGLSAVISIGAATLADMFEPAERGTKMGVYYMAPLLGPALGPIIGGALTSGLGWRSIFWFLTIVAGAIWMAFLLFFRDTFRKERSLTYQTVLKQHAIARAKNDIGHEAALPRTPAPASTHNVHGDVEKGKEAMGKEDADALAVPAAQIELTLRDVNPISPLLAVVRRINNLLILTASGLMYALTYMINYTGARTLSNDYHYDALMIGVITIAYGLGCVAGSILGGRWSDYKLSQLKKANGGIGYPEMRLKSTTIGLIIFPPSVVGFGWACREHTHVAVLCVLLFVAGFFTIWVYSSTLAYVVDANKGRSATAVATNSAFRGTLAFIATEIAVPMQDGIGDGWLYTFWGFLMALSGLLILLVSWKGRDWRIRAEEREAKATGMESH
ncbi:hypothetical protein AGABI2DRAFT_186299 [Agaricus bisporus var. bisporus H97]|uniref:hypothetical protein n=1 Tax=Agaricus bisporus var. bisporus (strain H97 / ATCC MYA-4626 / FGSC 10389) TaxID=936046 RepID=UPI00029F689B|nr:hypothetical protein AGABI2DRAFT_186299 [Agaricus bisporus var. bisporus H97]EKV45551.1 hypothetical protein AGABI2DRAFT_186299 [Agaricus bisporus var. bisporus H97]